MQITKIIEKTESQTFSKRKPLDPEVLQREFDYYRAESLLRQMLEKGFISEEEFTKIMFLNRKSFSPMLAQIMPYNP